MFIRVAYDPGPTFQQRLHQTDLERPDGSDEAALGVAHRQIDNILGIAIWDGCDWRTIEGSLPGMDR